MKKLVTIILLFTTLNCFSQTKDYKAAYEISKKHITEYKLKLSSTDSVVFKQDLQIQDLQSIIFVKSKLSKQDSLHISLLVQQKDFLNKNINLYKKELDRRDKFWNKPVFGIIIGVAGTVGLINAINYTLP